MNVAPATNRYTSGKTVTLTVMPAASQQFLGWSGDANGTQNPLTATMNSNKVITAPFTKRPRLEVPTWFAPMCQEGYRFLLTGEFGGQYQIEASTDLVQWTPLVTLTNTYGTVQFTDASATNLPQRFYRAVSP